jgi:hypothetical protein
MRTEATLVEQGRLPDSTSDLYSPIARANESAARTMAGARLGRMTD